MSQPRSARSSRRRGGLGDRSGETNIDVRALGGCRVGTERVPEMSRSTSERRLRVLHVILMLGETNGQYNEHCLPMVGMRDISICTYFVPQLTPPPEIDVFAGDGSVPGFFRTLRRALSAHDYDVIHVHAPQTGALVILALIGTLQIARIHRKLVYTVQDSFYDYKPRNQAMMVVALAGFRRIIFCSRAAFDSLPQVLKWLVGRRWRVVQNAADFDRIDQALSSGTIRKDESQFTVIAVGRLEPVKDHVTLLKAFAAAADESSRMVIVGAGSREDEVNSLIADLGLVDRVEMTGLIPRDEVFQRCAAADVLVSTSLGEGLPVAVIEAMATGCPVILSDIPPHHEVADGGDFIPIVPTGDVGGFAQAIQSFRDLSGAERQELGRRSRVHVHARFSLPIMHEGVEAVYRELPQLAGAG
jgi:glycosyltransferase involved in cell wall biosynthesis